MIENLKDFTKLLKLCRENGVTDVTVGTVSLKFGDATPKQFTGEMEELDNQDNNFIEALEKPLVPGEWAEMANGA
jgi:hypothetical protein